MVSCLATASVAGVTRSRTALLVLHAISIAGSLVLLAVALLFKLGVIESKEFFIIGVGMGLYVAFAPLGSLMYVSFLAVLPCHMHTASTLVLAFAVQAARARVIPLQPSVRRYDRMFAASGTQGTCWQQERLPYRVYKVTATPGRGSFSRPRCSSFTRTMHLHEGAGASYA